MFENLVLTSPKYPSRTKLKRLEPFRETIIIYPESHMKYIPGEYAGFFNVQGGGAQHPRSVTRDLLRYAFPSHV